MAAPKTASYWVDSVPAPRFSAFEEGVAVDVVVVGGGIAGITTALLLKRGGRRVAVLEARKVAQQVTGRTTAKVTSLHGLIYADLVSRLGRDAARIYGESNQSALEFVCRVVAEEAIDCDLQRKAAYTYSRSGERLERYGPRRMPPGSWGCPPPSSARSPCPSRSRGPSASSSRRSSTRSSIWMRSRGGFPAAAAMSSRACGFWTSNPATAAR